MKCDTLDTYAVYECMQEWIPLSEVIEQCMLPMDNVPIDVVQFWFRELFRAVKCLHMMNICHLQLEPRHIYVKATGKAIKVSGLEHAAFLDESQVKVELPGSCNCDASRNLNYASPELQRLEFPNRAISSLNTPVIDEAFQQSLSIERLKACDIWSLGAILFHVVFGKPPSSYQEENFHSTSVCENLPYDVKNVPYNPISNVGQNCGTTTDNASLAPCLLPPGNENSLSIESLSPIGFQEICNNSNHLSDMSSKVKSLLTVVGPLLLKNFEGTIKDKVNFLFNSQGWGESISPHEFCTYLEEEVHINLEDCATLKSFLKSYALSAVPKEVISQIFAMAGSTTADSVQSNGIMRLILNCLQPNSSMRYTADKALDLPFLQLSNSEEANASKVAHHFMKKMVEQATLTNCVCDPLKSMRLSNSINCQRTTTLGILEKANLLLNEIPEERRSIMAHFVCSSQLICELHYTFNSLWQPDSKRCPLFDNVMQQISGVFEKLLHLVPGNSYEQQKLAQALGEHLIKMYMGLNFSKASSKPEALISRVSFWRSEVSIACRQLMERYVGLGSQQGNEINCMELTEKSFHVEPCCFATQTSRCNGDSHNYVADLLRIGDCLSEVSEFGKSANLKRQYLVDLTSMVATASTTADRKFRISRLQVFADFNVVEKILPLLHATDINIRKLAIEFLYAVVRTINILIIEADDKECSILKLLLRMCSSYAVSSAMRKLLLARTESSQSKAMVVSILRQIIRHGSEFTTSWRQSRLIGALLSQWDKIVYQKKEQIGGGGALGYKKKSKSKRVTEELPIGDLFNDVAHFAPPSLLKLLSGNPRFVDVLNEHDIQLPSVLSMDELMEMFADVADGGTADEVLNVLTRTESAILAQNGLSQSFQAEIFTFVWKWLYENWLQANLLSFNSLAVIPALVLQKVNVILSCLHVLSEMLKKTRSVSKFLNNGVDADSESSISRIGVLLKVIVSPTHYVKHVRHPCLHVCGRGLRLFLALLKVQNFSDALKHILLEAEVGQVYGNLLSASSQLIKRSVLDSTAHIHLYQFYPETTENRLSLWVKLLDMYATNQKFQDQILSSNLFRVLVHVCMCDDIVRFMPASSTMPPYFKPYSDRWPLLDEAVSILGTLSACQNLCGKLINELFELAKSASTVSKIAAMVNKHHNSTVLRITCIKLLQILCTFQCDLLDGHFMAAGINHDMLTLHRACKPCSKMNASMTTFWAKWPINDDEKEFENISTDMHESKHKMDEIAYTEVSESPTTHDDTVECNDTVVGSNELPDMKHNVRLLLMTKQKTMLAPSKFIEQLEVLNLDSNNLQVQAIKMVADGLAIAIRCAQTNYERLRMLLGTENMLSPFMHGQLKMVNELEYIELTTGPKIQPFAHPIETRNQAKSTPWKPLGIATQILVNRLDIEIVEIKEIFDLHAENDKDSMLSKEILGKVLVKTGLPVMDSSILIAKCISQGLQNVDYLTFGQFLQVYGSITGLNIASSSDQRWIRLSSGYWKALTLEETNDLKNAFQAYKAPQMLKTDGGLLQDAMPTNSILDALSLVNVYLDPRHLDMYLHERRLLAENISLYEFCRLYGNVIDTNFKLSITRHSKVENVLQLDLKEQTNTHIRPSLKDTMPSPKVVLAESKDSQDTKFVARDAKSDHKDIISQAEVKGEKDLPESFDSKWEDQIDDSSDDGLASVNSSTSALGNSKIDNTTAAYKVFEMYDFDGDGRISFHDLRTVFRKRGWNLSDADIRAWINKRDQSQTGSVSFQDFKMTFDNVNGHHDDSTLRQSTKQLRIQPALTMPSSISQASKELDSIDGERLGGSKELNPEKARAIRRVFESYDYNGDGEISFLDLKKVLTQNGKYTSDSDIEKWLHARDRSGRGTVLLSDFIAAYHQTDSSYHP